MWVAAAGAAAVGVGAGVALGCRPWPAAELGVGRAVCVGVVLGFGAGAGVGLGVVGVGVDPATADDVGVAPGADAGAAELAARPAAVDDAGPDDGWLGVDGRPDPPFEESVAASFAAWLPRGQVRASAAATARITMTAAIASGVREVVGLIVIDRYLGSGRGGSLGAWAGDCRGRGSPPSGVAPTPCDASRVALHEYGGQSARAEPEPPRHATKQHRCAAPITDWGTRANLLLGYLLLAGVVSAVIVLVGYSVDGNIRDGFLVAGYSLAALALVGTVRAFFVALVFEPAHLIVRNSLVTRRIVWAEIADIAEIAAMPRAAAWRPGYVRVRLRDGSSIRLGAAGVPPAASHGRRRSPSVERLLATVYAEHAVHAEHAGIALPPREGAGGADD